MARIAVVDDAQAQRRILSALLEKQHAVTAYESGEALLEAIAQAREFDLVLLDIEMGGIDGYETCRRLREAGQCQPVIFVSAHETAPERVAAYQAGGDDFVVKPVTAHELRHKVALVLQQRAEIGSAQRVAFTAMTSMGELGVLMDFMRRSANCTDPDAIADALLAALESYSLHGVVQVRSRTGTLDKTNAQQASPLQTAVMASLRDMGRIFVFGSRGIVNYDHVSLLVHDLPTDDEERLGRLRDNLALLAEGAETRLAGLAASASLGLMRSEARQALDSLRETLGDAMARSQHAHQQNQRHTTDLLDSLSRLIDSYNVTDIQRETMQDMIEDGLDLSHRLYDEAALAESDFTRVIQLLEKLANNNK